MSLIDENFPDSGRSFKNSGPEELSRERAIDFLTINNNDIDNIDDLYHANGIFNPREIDYVGKRYRNGIWNPYQSISRAREYLFFTKPDLNIFSQNALGKIDGPQTVEGLFSTLQDIPFWNIMVDKYPDVIGCLQQSANINGSSINKFNHLLSNTVQTNLDVPGISANVIETPVNLYGVGYSYRSSSEASDDNPTFSLEFRDTRYLQVYHFFKAYEEYETLKHHGRIIPSMHYIQNKIVHDLYSVYKFLVDDDQETILYYGKYYGVMSKTVPRDVFSNTQYDGGLSYTVEFSAAFYDDMKPEILADFNALSYDYWSTLHYDVGPFNPNTGLIDNRPVKSAIVVMEQHNPNPNGKSVIVGVGKGTGNNAEPYYYNNPYPTPHSKDPGQWVYKLKWRGDDTN